ncbi:MULTISPECIES: hypothetical protein [unclassified Streptomyces]|uniref:hypothetical protein n=1 Tax=unclassified Streptomyces TaxID=2593676 RepID=UPI002E3013CA|nr:MULTISPECIES: hypothetical protein [unclassified Streptomyces]
MTPTTRPTRVFLTARSLQEHLAERWVSAYERAVASRVTAPATRLDLEAPWPSSCETNERAP